jgi:hypothetical protein
MLFRWENFSISFPPSLTGLCDNIDDKNSSDMNQRIKDLFILPSFDELDEVATDESGLPKLLDENQLISIKNKGFVQKINNFMLHFIN